MLQHDVADLLQFLTCVDSTCGVVGVADQDSLGAVGDALLELLCGRKSETILNGTGNAHYLRSCGAAESDIVCICGFGEDYLIARIESGEECKQHSLGTAGGDDDLVGTQVDVVTAIVFGEFLAQVGITIGRRILQHLAVDVFESVEAALRCGKVRLPYVQAVDLDAALTRFIGERSQFSYRRRGHCLATL